MDNPNFEFIKEYSEYFYEKCCQVDILIAMGFYEKAIASSRKIIECIVNPEDNLSLLDFLKENKYNFSKTVLDYLHDIRKCGNKAVHPNTYEWKKSCADNIAGKMHHVVIVELYKKRYNQKDFIDKYVPITEDNEWFLSKLYKPKFIKEVIQSADKDYLEIAIEEKVASNIMDLKEELMRENEKVITEMFKKYEVDEKEEFVLDSKQIEASHYWNDDEKKNNLIIQAGPGSGKTTVLIERVKFLINEKNVPPESILLITFTEKAANELKERLFDVNELDQQDINKIHVSTIHGFCRTVLKKYSFSGLEIIDDDNNEKKVMYIKNNRERLGLDDKYGYIPNNELKFVAKKFDEIDTFNVNSDELIEYLEDGLNKRLRKEEKYKKYIDNNSEHIITVENVKNRYAPLLQKHKFLTIAKAHKEYKELLKKNNVFDFNRLQTQTKEFLKENPDNVDFKNILVDEFQDTDQIQMEIFDLLLNNSQSVTYVGDPDQSIFSWRGSNPEFFDEICKRDDFKFIRLNKNYRSPRNIVDFNEYFMSKQRGSTPIDFKVKNEGYGDLFYIENQDALDEVQSIVEIIKFLRDNGKINSLSDIAIISNSVAYKTELFNELDSNGINYTIKGVKDVADSPEVKGVLALIWYLTDSMKDNSINFKTFCKSKINKEMFKFSESTLNVLLDTKDFHEFSTLSKNQLENRGLSGNDLEVFSNLNRIKKDFKDNELTILDVYYKLINVVGYVDSKYEILSCGEEKAIKNRELFNLSLISSKIKSYMEMNDEKDIDGLFDYLIDNYQDFSSPLNDVKEEDKVHILTAHKAKGLEFPFVIVSSLSDDGFPKTLKSRPFKIPINILYSKQYGDVEGHSNLNDIEKELLLKEQMRVLYVAMTRTKQGLILSTKGNSDVVNELSKFDDIKELSRDTLYQINFFNEEKSKKHSNLITLNFTSFENYRRCPHFYNLVYNYRFVSPQNTSMLIGSIGHNCLDAINTKTVNGEINDEEVENIIEMARKSNLNLEDNELFDDVLEEVDNYYYEKIKNNIWKVLHSEYPFSLFKEKNNIKFNLNGQIDLIIQEDKDDDLKISLVDYKTSAKEDNTHNYLDQLHVYSIAIQENPDFEGKDIENLIIYPLTGEELIENKFDINKKNQIEDDLYDTAKYILNYRFKKTDIKSKCKFCSLKDICNNG